MTQHVYLRAARAIVVSALMSFPSAAALSAQILVKTVRADSFTVALNQANVTGGATVTGTLTMAAPLAKGATALAGARTTDRVFVQLASSHPQIAEVPARAVLEAGRASVSFPVVTRGVAAVTSVTVSATLSGQTRTVNLTIAPATLAGISVGPATATGGTQVNAAVTLTGPAPAGGSTVSLASSQPFARVPAAVTVPAGASQAAFAVTVDHVATQMTSSIRATFGGATQAAQLTVKPVTIGSIEYLSLGGRVEGGGSGSTRVTLTGPAPAGGIPVILSSSHPAILQ
ncbi:MAG TPA: hypothetical protein VK864_08820, partial [Longimicrobiales bacterium]|nr:hypothetical protein [Longimicrobiales bacterium]